MADRTERPPSAAAYLANEARYAVQDIRQKLFEEAWFGRVVTPRPHHEIAPETAEKTPERRASFEDVWGPRMPQSADRDQRERDRAPEVER